MSLAAAHNLPPQPTALIGRKAVQAQAGSLLRAGTRLLTLLGPGGVGKTRLALEVAAELWPELPGGAWFVDLTGETHPGALLRLTAGVLGLTYDEAQPLVGLAAALQGAPPLLLYDNFESLPSAALPLGELLGACPLLRVLVTSRVPLGLRWEHRLPLSPLALPLGGDEVGDSAAVQLYLERARTAGAPPTADLQAVAQLCVRLDGLPLAIELAAARAVQLGPEALLARLDRQQALPVSASPDRPARHHSLSAAIGASYDLLPAGLQALLRRLSVASGGLSEEAVAEVAGTDALGLDTLEALLSLADVSLLNARPGQDGEPRYLLLETVRAYALGRADPAETLAARRRHLAWCLGLATRLAPRWRSGEGPQVLARLDEEGGNFRAALGWVLSPGPQGAASPTRPPRPEAADRDREAGVRLAETLWPFWLARGHAAEGRGWIEAALQAQAVPSVGLLRGAGVLACRLGDLGAAANRAERAVEAARHVPDARQEAAATGDLGVAWAMAGELGRAGEAFDLQHNLYLMLGDEQGAADALNNRGAVALRAGDWPRAAELLTQVLSRRRQMRDLRGEAQALTNLGVLACQTADWTTASAHLGRSLELRRQLGDPHGEAEALNNLSTVHLLSGDSAGATALAREALALRTGQSNPQALAAAQLSLGRALLAEGELTEAAGALLAATGLAMGSVRGSVFPGLSPPVHSPLSGSHRAGVAQFLADLSARLGDWPLAARLLGAAEAMSGPEAGPWPAERQAREAQVEAARVALGRIDLDEALSVGRRLTWEEVEVQAAALAANAAQPVTADPLPEVLVSPEAGSPRAEVHRVPAPVAGSDGLSEREREVLGLLLLGWPNKKIASSLGLADNTVKNHLASVYGKLGVRGRAEAVARTLQENLLR